MNYLLKNNKKKDQNKKNYNFICSAQTETKIRIRRDKSFYVDSLVIQRTDQICVTQF